MKKTLLKLLLILTTFTIDIVAEDKPRAVIIFDASGSMWGQIDGKSKISIAKNALSKVVNEWNPHVELGLTVYGHRKKGDCNDIETVIPVGMIDKNKILSIVKKIQPKGKTPISRTLKKVAEEIKYTEEKATIILISDGKESCDADPCGTAKELEKQGIDFVTHVIGFNVDKKTSQQLECIADATGGEYFSAKNATALNDAMKSIVKKVEVEKPIFVPVVVKKVKPTVEVTASEKEGGKWVQASCRVYKMLDGKVDDSDNWSIHNMSKKQAGSRQLPVGKYQLNCSYNEFKTKTAFELKAGEVTKVHVVFEQFRIETKCTDMNANVSYEVYASSGRMVYETQAVCSKPIQLSIDAGTYTAEAKIGNDTKEEKFIVGGGVSKLLMDMTSIKKVN